MASFFRRCCGSSSAEAGSEDRFTRVIYAGLPTTHFATNKVTNTKYTILSFIPINLYDQFGRFMNQYFLFIALLQLWPAIVVVHPALSLVPLMFILTLSAVKEAIDDYYRFQSDKQANERQYYAVRQGEKRVIQSQDLRVGDIIWLKENEEIPCDVLLLATPEPSGVCYIQTTNLDGESDLKLRQALPATAALSTDRIHRFRGVIECPVPNAEIYKWDARLRLTEDGSWLSLSDRQMLLAATHLRNCEWIYGIVIYTGNETKVGKNKRVPSTKYTATDDFVNKLSIFIFALQLSLVLILAIAGWIVQVKERKDLWYIAQGSLGFIDWPAIPLRFIVLMSIMIPISLKVSQDIMKFGSAKIINWDDEMRDPHTGRAEAKNTAISDDLGQIEIVFSDKTGTLTENRMAFVKCTINGQAYGYTSQHPNALQDPALQRAVDSRDAAVMDFFRVLALCHSVVPYEGQGELKYRASSPDEKALVDAARYFKVVFAKRSQQALEINVVGTPESYQLLNVLDFTSDRKRMSVILRNTQTGIITLLMKGADDKVIERLRGRNQTVEATVSYVETFAKIGLRTLCIACKEVTQQEYSEWALRLQEAQTLMQGRDQRVAEVYDMIEHQLVLIGATAIEDKLQEAVPETIGILRRAGCKVWMLTGDKYSTAIQIASSCNLIAPGAEANLLTVSGVSAEDIKRSVEECLRKATELKTERKIGSVIIEGNILKTVLAHYAAPFTELCLLVSSVICCRVTPEQKGQVVALCKQRGMRTLAIGDGGNDVTMIQEAHVGVGIRGEEGMQAARAADYAIGKFKYLARLMLIHGRYSYKRTSFAAQYMFYKSSFLCFVQVYYAFLTKVSGAAFFSEYSQTMYNIVYTSLPVLFFLLDKDVSEDAMVEYPELYGESQRGENLNILTFASWLLRSVVQSLLLMGVLVKAYGPDYTAIDGTGNTYDITQAAAYTAIIIIQCVTMALETHFFTLLNHVAIWGTLGAYFLITAVYSLVIPPTSDDYYIFAHALGEAQFWAIVALLVVASMGPVFLIKYLKNEYWPAHYVSVRRWEKERRSGRSPGRRLSGGDVPLSGLESGRFSGDTAFHTLKPEVSNESLKSPLLQN